MEVKRERQEERVGDRGRQKEVTWKGRKKQDR